MWKTIVNGRIPVEYLLKMPSWSCRLMYRYILISGKAAGMGAYRLRWTEYMRHTHPFALYFTVVVVLYGKISNINAEPAAPPLGAAAGSYSPCPPCFRSCLVAPLAAADRRCGPTRPRNAFLIGILALRTPCAVYGPVAVAGFTAYARLWV